MMQVKLKQLCDDHRVFRLALWTGVILFAKTLVILIGYPLIYSTKAIFESWYRFFPRRFDENKNIFEGVDFRNSTTHNGKPLIEEIHSNKTFAINFANFSGMRLYGKFFRCCYADSANFSGADLTNAIFLDTNLSFADFRGANLTRCAFVQCDGISLAKFSDPKEKGFVPGTLCKVVFTDGLLSYFVAHPSHLGCVPEPIEEGNMLMLVDVDTKNNTFSFLSPATGNTLRDLPAWIVHTAFEIAPAEEN